MNICIHLFLTRWLTQYLRSPEDKKNNSKVACVTIDPLPRVSTNKTDCHDIMKYC